MPPALRWIGSFLRLRDLLRRSLPLPRLRPADRAPRRHSPRSPRRRLHNPPHRARPRARTVTRDSPPTNLRPYPLSLGERSVSDQYLGGAQAYRPRLADRLQVSTVHGHAVPDRLFDPGRGGGLHLRRLTGAQLDTLIDAMNQHVAHGSSGPVAGAPAGIRRLGPGAGVSLPADMLPHRHR